MKVLVVYESMFGNTHVVADHVGTGLGAVDEVTVASVADVGQADVDGADLVVVGGPTHVHGVSSAMSRKAAAEQAETDDALDLDPDAEGPGLRDWFDGIEGGGTPAAAFDTRVDATSLVTGRASKGIARRLRGHGFDVVTEPESFLVDKENVLLDGEADRAEAWGAQLASEVASVADA